MIGGGRLGGDEARLQMSAQMITGRLASGIGQGRHFTRLDWARKQFMDRLDIDPFPGTINVIVSEPDSLAGWTALKATPGIRIDNPNDGPFDCDARCYRVEIAGGIAGAIVFPEVDGYPAGQIEIIAAVGVRDALGIVDGDVVRLVTAISPAP